MENERSWGVTPVPDRLRTLSLGDLTLLWGNLGISLLVLAAGTYLAGLGLQQGLLAIVVGAVLGCTLLGLAGYIGAERRVPAMVLMREPLGQRGSYAPTVLNVIQNLGWAIFELIVISTAANALADRLFGFRERWVWVLIFGTITLALALAGPIAFVRRYVRRFAIWAVAASVGYLTWWALDGASFGDLWRQDGEGGSSVLDGVDLVVAITVSWIPLAADYTRFSRTRSGAFWGTGGGYLIASMWMWMLGAVLFFSRDLTDAAALPAAVAAGGIGALLALLAVTVDETDEAFANVYSTAVSVQNLAPALPQRLLVAAVAAVATLGALTIDLLSYESFLLLLGSFFVPLFGILLADWLAAGARYVRADVFNGPAVRWGMLGAWIAGFALYQWLHPVGPSWWTDAIGEGAGLGIGATLPSFAVSLALGLAVAALGRRRF
jgi:nucleobase:cation symporter-1, NCS1 family